MQAIKSSEHRTHRHLIEDRDSPTKTSRRRSHALGLISAWRRTLHLSIMSLAGRRARDPREKYTYSKLKDAVMCVNEKVNFYGVVSEYEQPKRTQGTDCLCTMTVIDMGYDGPGLRVLYFAPIEMLPQVKAVGDIIRFHRIKMTIYNNAVQAVGNPKQGSSFVVLHGPRGDDYEPYQKSHGNFTMEAHDHEVITLLRAWVETQPLHASAGETKYLVPIKDIKGGSYFDLYCKVVYVKDQVDENNVVIYVWDGTDASPVNSIHLEHGQRRDSDQDLWSSEDLAVPIDIMRSFPALGTVLALIPDMPKEELAPQLPVAGDWVKLRNIGCRIQNGFYEGIILRKSKIGIVSCNSQVVQHCERAYEERLASDDLRLPQWCPKPLQSISVTSYDHVKLSSLREVLTHPQVTYKFRSMVQVMAAYPSEVLDFCVPLDQGESASKAHHGEGAFVYVVRLTLEDPTARIHAFLYGEDAVEFFNGYPAADLRQQGDTVGALKRKVQRLLGVQETGPANPPWVKCCLMSYYTDQAHPRESRRFRIFGTRLPG